MPSGVRADLSDRLGLDLSISMSFGDHSELTTSPLIIRIKQQSSLKIFLCGFDLSHSKVNRTTLGKRRSLIRFKFDGAREILDRTIEIAHLRVGRGSDEWNSGIIWTQTCCLR